MERDWKDADNRVGVLFILPFVATALIFMVFPVVEAVRMAFFHIDPLNPTAQRFAGLDNFRTLFADARRRPLPGWAAEIDCTSWAQIFLKFILGHPAVTCPIPATSNPAHMADDVRAGFGRLPDEAMRRRIVKELLG